MTRNELDRLLRGLARQRPFRVFWIEFFSRERLAITNPEAVGRRLPGFVREIARIAVVPRRYYPGRKVAPAFQPESAEDSGWKAGATCGSGV